MHNQHFERIVGKEGSHSLSYKFMAILGYGVALLGYALMAWEQGQQIIGLVTEIQPHHVWLVIISGLFMLMCALPKYFQPRYVLPLIWCTTLICVAEAFRTRQPEFLEELRQLTVLGLLIVVGIPIGMYRLYWAYRKGDLGADASDVIRSYSLAMVMWGMCLAYGYISWRTYSDGAHHFLAGRPFIYAILVALGSWFAVSDGGKRPYILPIATGSIVVLELAVWSLKLAPVRQFLFEDHLHELIFAGHLGLVTLFFSLLYQHNKSAIRDKFRELFPTVRF